MAVEEFDMQCIYCWVPVRARGGGLRTWGKGEDADDKNWVHAYSLNASGNPVCSRVALTDDEIEPIAEAE